MRKGRRNTDGVPTRKEWDKARENFIRGEETALDIARRLNVSASTVRRRMDNQQWSHGKKEIQKRVKAAVTDKIVSEAEKWIADMKFSCIEDMRRIVESYDQMQPAADPGAIRALTQAKRVTDDIMRRCLSLPDAPQKFEHSGGVTLQLIDPYAEEPESE